MPNHSNVPTPFRHTIAIFVNQTDSFVQDSYMRTDYSAAATQMDSSPILDVHPLVPPVSSSHVAAQVDPLSVTENENIINDKTPNENLSQNSSPSDEHDILHNTTDGPGNDLINNPFADTPSFGRLGGSYASLKIPATPLPPREGSPPRQSAPISPVLARRALSEASYARRMSRRSAATSSVGWSKENMSDEHEETFVNNGARPLSVSAVGAFKDLQTSIAPVPSDTVVGGVHAASRLTKLKRKLNELQAKRRAYWLRQGGTMGAGAVGSWVSLGGSVVLSSAAALHQRNRLAQIKRAMREVIQQINQLRTIYSEDEEWQVAERAVRIDPKVFSKDISRVELWGDL